MLQEKKFKRSVNYDNETENGQINYDDIINLLDGIDHFENNNKINTTKELIVNQNNTSKRFDNIGKDSCNIYYNFKIKQMSTITVHLYRSICMGYRIPQI